MKVSESLVILLAILVIGMGCYLLVSGEVSSSERCRKASHGKPYTKEKTFVSPSGCNIREVELYNENCDFVDKVYASSCSENTKWNYVQQQGKFSSTITKEVISQ